MKYVLNENQYRQLMASIYMDLEYDNYKKSRVFKLMLGKKYNKMSKKVEKYPSLVVSMERLQMRGASDRDLIITFDTNFKIWSDMNGTADMTGGCQSGGSAVRSLSGEYIMGVSTSNDIPKWLTQGLEDAGVFRKI